MKCSICGKEIANDSNFCEFCGSPVEKNSEKNKKARITLGVILVSIVGLAFLFIPHYNQTHVVAAEEAVDSTVAESLEYVDLGLPSGTLWKGANEDGLCSSDEAMERYGNMLPTKEQFEELKTKCQWTWTGSECRVTGPNGSFIVLPAEGYSSSYGDICNVGSYGYYWSSTADWDNKAWDLFFNSENEDLSLSNSSDAQSVRLVKNE